MSSALGAENRRFDPCITDHIKGSKHIRYVRWPVKPTVEGSNPSLPANL